ncbi:MAG: FG-GAP-like repeat-containing protein [Nannocystaceae bacterium]
MRIGSFVLATLATLVPGVVAATVCVDPTPGHPLGSELFTSVFGNGPGGVPALPLALSVAFADVDGDGDDDVCSAGGSKVSCMTHRNKVGDDPCFHFGDYGFTASFSFNLTNYTSRWTTIGYPDLDGDGDDDLCVRGPDGMYCALAQDTDFGAPTRWSTNFGENNGWGAAKYYETIGFPDIDGDGRDDVCGRGSAGIHCGLSTGTAFAATSLLWTTFSDVNGWGSSASYYGTIQYGDVDDDGRDDVCGRGSAGIYCATAGQASATLWTTQFSDAAGWGQEKYWSTIKLADVAEDWHGVDVCGRGSGGIHCGLAHHDHFEQAEAIAAPDFSDAHGWDQPKHYRTITFADVDGNGEADVCGRGNEGVYCATAMLFPGGGGGGIPECLPLDYCDFVFEEAQLWTSNFGDNNGWGSDEAYWGTVHAANVVDAWAGDEFCGRGSAGIWCSYR